MGPICRVIWANKADDCDDYEYRNADIPLFRSAKKQVPSTSPNKEFWKLGTSLGECRLFKHWDEDNEGTAGN